LSRIAINGFNTGIHGDKKQEERDWVLNEFKSGKNPILIATDVAARGLDVKDIKCVINFDFPNQIEDYVHRIGRTGTGTFQIISFRTKATLLLVEKEVCEKVAKKGRAGATGEAYSFFTADKGRMARELIDIMQEANQVVPPELQQMAMRYCIFSRGFSPSSLIKLFSSGYGGGKGGGFRGGGKGKGKGGGGGFRRF